MSQATIDNIPADRLQAWQQRKKAEKEAVTPVSLARLPAQVTSNGLVSDEQEATLLAAFITAVEGAEKPHRVICRNCKHVTHEPYPDLRARQQALQFIVEHKHGKPGQKLTIEQDTLQGLGQLRAWLELMTQEERQVLSGFVDRMTAGER